MDTEIAKLCGKAIAKQVFPGCVVGIANGRHTTILPFGTLDYSPNSLKVLPDTPYDVASITKSVVTASLALRLIEQGKLSLEDKVIKYVPELTDKYREDILIKHLLTYTVIFKIKGGLAALAKSTPQTMFYRMCETALRYPPGEHYIYTNPPALILGAIVERITKQTLGELSQRDIFKPLKMLNSNLGSPIGGLKRTAPTEIDWRGELRGLVHDEAAWAMAENGRLAGNSGLFSTAHDLLIYSRMLMNKGAYAGGKIFEPETIVSMYTNQIKDLGKSTGLGWEIKQPLVMGKHMSRKAFGKTGFTGCIMIIDPVKHIALVHLSNRTYPHRPETRNAINLFRRTLANMVFSAA